MHALYLGTKCFQVVALALKIQEAGNSGVMECIAILLPNILVMMTRSLCRGEPHRTRRSVISKVPRVRSSYHIAYIPASVIPTTHLYSRRPGDGNIVKWILSQRSEGSLAIRCPVAKPVEFTDFMGTRRQTSGSSSRVLRVSAVAAPDRPRQLRILYRRHTKGCYISFSFRTIVSHRKDY